MDLVRDDKGYLSAVDGLMSVERCMRNAAHKVSMGSEAFKDTFPGKVTNSLLISTILSEIKLKEMEYKKIKALICRLKIIFIVKFRKRLPF